MKFVFNRKGPEVFRKERSVTCQSERSRRQPQMPPSFTRRSTEKGVVEKMHIDLPSSDSGPNLTTKALRQLIWI